MRCCLAIDIGASSGRHIVGWLEKGEIQTREVYRFPNGVREEQGHLVWDVEALVREVKAGICAAKAAFPEIESLSIDTWGVDYVLLKGDREVLPVYAYRDNRTETVIPQVHEKMAFPELYRRTGCQFQAYVPARTADFIPRFHRIFTAYCFRSASSIERKTSSASVGLSFMPSITRLILHSSRSTSAISEYLTVRSQIDRNNFCTRSKIRPGTI